MTERHSRSNQEQQGLDFVYSAYTRSAEDMKPKDDGYFHHGDIPEIWPFTTVFCLAMRPFHTRYCRCLAVSLSFPCGDDGMTFLNFLLGVLCNELAL